MSDNMLTAAVKRMFTRDEKPAKGGEKVASAATPASAPEKRPNPILDRAGVLEKRMRDAGLACGGKVKRYNSGGAVRGCGVAVKGKTKGVMR